MSVVDELPGFCRGEGDGVCPVLPTVVDSTGVASVVVVATVLIVLLGVELPSRSLSKTCYNVATVGECLFPASLES